MPQTSMYQNIAELLINLALHYSLLIDTHVEVLQQIQKLFNK